MSAKFPAKVMVAVTTPMMAMMEGVEMTVTTTSVEGLEMAVTTSMMAVIMRGVIVIPTMTSVLLMEGAEMGVAETTPMVAIVEGLKTMVAMVEGVEMGAETVI